MSDLNFKPPFHLEFTTDGGQRVSCEPSDFSTFCALLGYAPSFTIVMEQPK
jgi:hypothetical protein